MKRIAQVPAAVVVLAGVAAESAHAFGQTEEAAPIFGVEIPAGYRDLQSGSAKAFKLRSLAQIFHPGVAHDGDNGRAGFETFG